MSNSPLDNLFVTLPAGAAVGAALAQRGDSGDGFGDILKNAGQGTSIGAGNDPGSQRDDQNLSAPSQQAGDDDRSSISHWNAEADDSPTRDSANNSQTTSDYADRWRSSQPSNSQPQPSRPSSSSANDHSRDDNQSRASDRSITNRSSDDHPVDHASNHSANSSAKTNNAKDRQSNDDKEPSKPASDADASRAAGSTNTDAGPVKPPPTDNDAKQAAAAEVDESEAAAGDQKQAANAAQTNPTAIAGGQVAQVTTGAELPGNAQELALGTKTAVAATVQTNANPSASAPAAKFATSVKAVNQATAQAQQQTDANLAAAQSGQQPINGASPNQASTNIGVNLASAGKQAGKANCENGSDGSTPPIRPLGSNDENSDQSQQANSVEASWASAVAQATALPAGTLQVQIPLASTSESKSSETKSNSSTDAVVNQSAAVSTDRGATGVPAASGNQMAAANTSAKLSTDGGNGQPVIGPPRAAASQIDPVRFVQRVARAFRAADEQGGEIRLRLSPPELGALKVEVAIRNGVMTARLEAETTIARSLLVDNLPNLRARLADQNIKIDRFDVDLKQDGRGDSSANLPSDSNGNSRQGAWRGQTVSRSTVAGSQSIGAAPIGSGPTGRAADGQINVVI
ncbi:MAG TPA: flagellar hook-length control protein FliK [Pirellulales bacterium]|jgi:flagellar hook-length control protein FliK